jgi:hypothetical protein
VLSNSIPINSQNLLTEPISPHYTETYKVRIYILILKSIELIGSLKHVINIILQIRYMSVITLPLKQNHISRFERRIGPKGQRIIARSLTTVVQNPDGENEGNLRFSMLLLLRYGCSTGS